MQRKRKIIEWETRDLFKQIRDTKGTFHAKMGTIKDRNGMDLTEAEVDVFLELLAFSVIQWMLAIDLWFLCLF